MTNIDITDVDLVEFVKEVYKLSSPQGLGFLHFTEEPLSDQEAKDIIGTTFDSCVAVSMDYIKGRACKMTVFIEGDRKVIPDSWYDHSKSQLISLLDKFNVEHDLKHD